MANESVFNQLYFLDCKEHVEYKNGLSYLSWAWAWAECKKLFPTSNYYVYENKDGLNYHTDGRTCWVKVGVTIALLEHIEYLPVMDNRNNSIPLEKVTSMDVNKAIQRGLTKALARHGLGLWIYAGEDLPEENPDEARARLVRMFRAAKSRQDFVNAYHEAQRLKLTEDEEINALVKECSRKYPNQKKSDETEAK